MLHKIDTANRRKLEYWRAALRELDQNLEILMQERLKILGKVIDAQGTVAKHESYMESLEG